MSGSSKSASNALEHGRSQLRFSALLFIITIIPLTLSSQTAQAAYAYSPENCQLSMQNTYPTSAVAGRLILISTTITNACSYFLLEAIVEIMLPNSGVVLSTAIADPIAVNRITAPQMNGFWKLDVVVSFTYYPLTGRLASFRSPITIEVFGPLARSTKSLTSSARVTTSLTTSTSTSNVISSSTSATASTSPVPLQLISTNTTSSSSSTSSASPPAQYFWQGSNSMLIIAVAFLMLFVSVVVIRLRRRGRGGAKN